MFFVNVEVFRDILNICPKVSSKAFDESPTEEEALSFIRELGHNGEIKYITDGMYYKKNLDFVNLIWEDLAYQIDNKDSKKQDKLFYPKFTKIIIHHFITKDKSISMRNIIFMHTARDDTVLGTMRFVSRHKDTQVYGVILPKPMTNQALLDSVAYKTYYAIASGAEPPKLKKSLKKSGSTISSGESPSKKKSAKSKKTRTKPKPFKKKALVKADGGKGVPDKQQWKTFGTDKGTGTKPGVPNVPKYDSESDKESWSDSGEEYDDDDVDDDEEQTDDNDNDDYMNDDDETDSERTESDKTNIPNLNKSSSEEHDEDEENVDERVHTPSDYELNDDGKIHDEEKIDDVEKMVEEEDDDVTKELYKDVNVNLGNKDADMTEAE
uniref:Uncharacterized protein n=1 Tax=Tanacetum cinerariifolium TaxID=118510 RepID=A0A699H145_TANCI|nr:hypothetical protein [Tanacetum cinerariifolium]